MPFISIITPVYNCHDFIGSCIDNVAAQREVDLEHIIIDGGSSDGTVEIIEAASHNYSHIRWLSEPDGGQSDAMNKGIALAAGPVLGFLNADDYYAPDTLNRVNELFRSLVEPTLAVGNCNVWRADGSLWFVSAPRKLGWRKILAGRYREAFPMNPSAYFYHKSLHDLIGPYNPEDHFSMDVDFILRALMNARSVYFDELWGNYRYLPGTKTFEDDMSGNNAVRLAALRARYLRGLPFQDRLKIEMENLFIRLLSRMKVHL